MTEMHECPKEGCGSMIPLHVFACRNHWFSLPQEMRSAISNSWRKRRLGREGGLEEHRQATDKAIEYLNLTT